MSRVMPGDGGEFALYTWLVMPPTKGANAFRERAGRRRSGPAGCGSPSRIVFVAGRVPDRKNEVVYVAPPLLVAIREAGAGARGVAVRRWSRLSSRTPPLRWRLHG